MSWGGYMEEKECNRRFTRIKEDDLENSLKKNIQACAKYMWTEYDGDESYWEELEKEKLEKKDVREQNKNIKSVFEIAKEKKK